MDDVVSKGKLITFNRMHQSLHKPGTAFCVEIFPRIKNSDELISPATEAFFELPPIGLPEEIVVDSHEAVSVRSLAILTYCDDWYATFDDFVDFCFNIRGILRIQDDAIRIAVVCHVEKLCLCHII